MDTNGLQKKILELSKKAAQLQVSNFKAERNKKSTWILLGSSEGGIFAARRQSVLNLSMLKDCSEIVV